MNEICPTCNGSGGIDVFEDSIGEIVTIPCPDCGWRGMNLSKLFEMQRQLDAHIEKEHPRQEGEDRLAKKILALMVELGELANEWRGFKFWSHDQEPRTVEYCPSCGGSGFVEYFDPFDAQGHIQDKCMYCEGHGITGRMPLLEEYVDCLHFILSIGLELNIPEIYGTETKWDELTSDETDITQQFLLVFENVNKLVHPIDWINLFEEFYILGKMLGYTWEEVEEAYMKSTFDGLNKDI